MSAPVSAALWQGDAYARSAMVLRCIVRGEPIPQGSKSFKGVTQSGRAVLVESSKNLKPWRATVQTGIEQAMRASYPTDGFPLQGPLAVDLAFTVRKPTSAPKTRTTYPAVKPDLDKLVRAVLDAATYARLWGDDSQVVDITTWKTYPGETPRSLSKPGVAIAVYTVTNPTSPTLPQRSELPL